MVDFFTSRIAAFKYALAGWWYVIRTQRNAWVHAAASIMVISISIWLQINITEWLFIIIAIAFVWTAEFINTALEVVVDLATKEQHPLARAGKDVGAAAVMIASLTSMIIGVLVLGPKLWDKLFQ
ncbi:MAG: diacylglycerol kinase family protein [Chloroflexota bacterium]